VKESESFTAGFAFDQPFSDAFDMSIGATYFDIDIENTVIEPGVVTSTLLMAVLLTVTMKQPRVLMLTSDIIKI